MKTFSAMSVPDLELTILAYDQLITHLERSMKPERNSSGEIIGEYQLQVLRLRQLLDAAEKELLSQ